MLFGKAGLSVARRKFMRGFGVVAAAGASAVLSRGVLAAVADQRTPAQRGSTIPRWMQGVPVNQWTAIPGSALSGMDCTAQLAAGLTNSRFQDIGYGDPRRGIVAYSGGALKTDGSEMLIFGGGGAGAWAGNDVRGLRLEDDAPVWRTRVNPTVAAKVPSRYAAPAAYMLDGRTPSARHSYWSPQFIDAKNRFMVFGCAITWASDTGQFYVVDGVAVDTGVWDAPGTYPDIPLRRGWDGNWTCKHPVTEDVYVSSASAVSRWTRAKNAWSTLWQSTRTDVDRASAAIDPTGNGTLLRVGDYGSPNVPVAINLATGAAAVGSFTGPYAGAISIGGYYAAGLVYDKGLGKFLLFQDDGHLYAITRVSVATWSVDRMVLSGTAPDALHSAGAGLPAIWGRMQYVPNLDGVCIIQAYDRPAYFVKTR